jgi:hypothetical protein
MVIMNGRAQLWVCCSAVLSLISIGCRRPNHEPKGNPMPTSSVPVTKRSSEPAPGALKTSELSVTDPLFQDRLLRGFYGGTPGWKWTGREFAVSLDVPPPLDAPTELNMDLSIPSELINAVHQVTVTTRVNGSSSR